jgi:pilus assembly protein CpaB
MNLRTILLLVVALGAAGFTAYFAQNWLMAQRDAFSSQAKQEPVPDIPTDEILVAKDNLPTGSFVKAEQLTWQPWPKEGIKEEYVVKGSGSEMDLEGAVVRTHLLAGEPITASRVIHPGDRGFLAAVLEEGKRAVSVPVDATTGIAGFVFPGDWVDVILTFRTSVQGASEDASAETRYFSETLLTEVRILAIDQKVESVDGAAQVAKTATLEVSAKQAEKIAIAMSIGSLSLSLRSLAKEEPPAGDAAEPAGAASGDVSAAAPAATGHNAHSYTRDIDIYYMRGDPLGIPTSGVSSTVTVLRGSESGEVKF